MDYYNEIKHQLINAEIYAKVKDLSKERYKTTTYFEIGKLLNEAGGKYGDNIINEYSKKLTVEVGKKYNRRTLFRMRQFYNLFSDEKVSPLVTQLTWTHCITLLALKDYNEINYYINQTVNRNLSKRQLEDAIKFHEYERLPEKTKLKIAEKEEAQLTDFVKNPIIIKGNNENNNRKNFTTINIRGYTIIFRRTWRRIYFYQK